MAGAQVSLRKKSAKSPEGAQLRKKAKGVGESRGQFYLYLIPGMLSFLIVIGGSFFYNVYIGFTKWNGLGHPHWVGMQNYTKLMHDATFWQSFVHAFYFIAAMSIIPTFLGVFLAGSAWFAANPRSRLNHSAHITGTLYGVLAGLVVWWAFIPGDLRIL